jgi:hypothetical protein
MTSEPQVAPCWEHDDYNLSELLGGIAGRVLETYSNIPHSELESHVKDIVRTFTLQGKF